MWDAISYDPELDLLYIGVGNSSLYPRARRSPGGGDNLFVSSIVALRPDDGSCVLSTFSSHPASSGTIRPRRNSC